MLFLFEKELPLHQCASIKNLDNRDRPASAMESGG